MGAVIVHCPVHEGYSGGGNIPDPGCGPCRTLAGAVRAGWASLAVTHSGGGVDSVRLRVTKQ